jgi:argininosuccinate lyase
MAKLWEGRLTDTEKIVDVFTSSLSIDKRLFYYDLTGTLAHVFSLHNSGILKADELKDIAHGLKELREHFVEFDLNAYDYEDIHSLIENELKDSIGDKSEKIHTARSRNDQVVLDEKLFIKDAIIGLVKLLQSLLETISKLSADNIRLIMPAYTHLQKAQPVLVSHYLMSFFEKFLRDLRKLLFNFEETDILPLGSAACTGSGYEIDRDYLKKILRFRDASKNSMDEVSNRDYISDFIYSMTNIMLHLSRFSEDLIIFNSTEFSFINISDSFCTGSSIMPQKKNPDILELIRAKSSLLVGNLNQILIIFKGLPSTYNRDMQEDKTILFNAYDQTYSSIEIFIKLLDNVSFNQDVLNKALLNGFIEATDLADYLVKKGQSFRSAHKIVGKVVRYCLGNSKNICDLKIEDLKKFSEFFEEDLYKSISIDSCIESKNVFGGTNKRRVEKSLESAKEELRALEKTISSLEKRVIDFDDLLKIF